MDYATLSETIKAYAENDFPNTPGSGGLTSQEQIDTFIREAEQRIYNTVELPAFRKNQVGNFTSGNRFLSVPADWMAMYEISVVDGSGAYSYLLNKDVSFLRESYPDPTVTGVPQYYAIFDKDTLVVAPTPDAVYATEMHYFYQPESIVTAGTTWLGDNFDQVLLYGALMEAAAFMQAEEDILNLYDIRYDEAMASLKVLGEGKNRSDKYRNTTIQIM